MRRLSHPAEAARWLAERVRGGLQCDSRRVAAGDGFIAWPGAASDGRRYVAAALAQGAAACLVEAEGVEAFELPASDALACYAGLKAATGPIAAAYYGAPSEQLEVLAVTGTNGKTSTAWWLAQALLAVRPTGCGMIGTLGVGRPPQLEWNGLTTPDPVLLQSQFRRFVDQGLSACAIEASSIGIAEGRLEGTRIRVAIFTNFTRDHLDYHGSMEAYWQAKARLFQWPGLQAAVVNVDDPRGAELARSLAGAGLDLWTTACEGAARLRAQDIVPGDQGLRFTVIEGEDRLALATRLIGQYNVANLLGVIAAQRALGVPLADAVRACEGLLPVPGRMECLGGAGEPLVAVDYAHTPDALEKALAALRPLAQRRGGRLWCVFGCGGDRDASKRPLMAAVAERHADAVVVTSDNPRSESPEAIIGQVLAGLSRREAVQVEPDRARAIAGAIAAAAPADVLLLAGKGHEDYQEIAGVKQPFDDRVQAREALGRRPRESVGAREATALVDSRLRGNDGGRGNDADRGIDGNRGNEGMDPMFSLSQALTWIPGGTLAGDGATPIARVHTDTRSLQPGDLFVALKGERFDANELLAEATARGAAAVLAHRGRIPAGLAGIEVDDTRLALGQLAAGWRAQHALPLIAVTGSNGKTTVTQMVASILRAWQGEAALATEGNFNNDIGLPLTLLRLRATHRVAVLELGMNHPGEIAYLAGIARPTVALVNNAQREHQEFMASVEAVARENGSVLEALAPQGTAVFPAADEFSTLWRQLAGPRACLTFGGPPAADIVLAGSEWQAGHWRVAAQTPAGPVEFPLHVAGRHNVLNALAAAACALAAGAPLAAIAQGLASFEPVKGRSRALAVALAGRTLTLVDDSYNANPDSVRAAIDVLAELPGPQLLVLGDMGEVGTQGPQFHAEVGAYARERGIAHLLTLGEQARAMGGRHFEDIAALHAAVRALLPEVSSVLVKGSRFMKMERVVEAIRQQAQQGGAA